MTDEEQYIRPDVKAFVAALASIGSKPISELSLEEARGGYLALHAMGDRPPRELAVIRDLACPGPGGEIPVRLYDARETRQAGPVIVFYHGGGYVIGDLESHHNLCTEIAAQMDLPVVAVDYRRAPEHPFPAAVDDCEAAARWAASSPPELARPATGLVLMGDSAGGNASIVTAQALAENAAAVPVVLQVPLFPLATDIADCASLDVFAEGFILTKAAVEFFDVAYAADRSDPRATPILGDIAASPPTVLVTAGLDPIRDSGRAYGGALATAGVEMVFLEMKGLTHSFTNLRLAIPSAQTDLERVFAAMKLMLNTNSGGAT
ncbi:alpha/beta hydrolase [Allopontixanthobacter sediminis]|uniref:Alpha/beta hydrolase fold domain-containing protein n=1 Tax=Allopontixanthobacter sediminis TaxID=1689985 RepID=A0A845AYU5_9SPHN|nr:alpha/beta hydrolase [Allopontixanthobacter sediminis]MXP43445.1 alpha/beta hydrolase fold domain-containing protein [Allopontixanthobacter sediminis]